MNDYEEMALELSQKHGIELCYAREAAMWIIGDDIPESEAMEQLHDMYGDNIYG